MRIPIVNEKDEIVEIKNIKDRNSTDIYRAVALWITSENGDILLAQRAFTKKYDPGLWGSAVAGIVEEGETYESNVIKEAEEELGLKNVKPAVAYKVRRSTVNEYFCQYFTLTIPKNTDFKIQTSEVAQVKWFTKEELLNSLDESPEIFVPNYKKVALSFINSIVKNNEAV